MSVMLSEKPVGTAPVRKLSADSCPESKLYARNFPVGSLEDMPFATGASSPNQRTFEETNTGKERGFSDIRFASPLAGEKSPM
jgi:hypothetical protein